MLSQLGMGLLSGQGGQRRNDGGRERDGDHAVRHLAHEVGDLIHRRAGSGLPGGCALEVGPDAEALDDDVRSLVGEDEAECPRAQSKGVAQSGVAEVEPWLEAEPGTT